jgi:hypothetical protein
VVDREEPCIRLTPNAPERPSDELFLECVAVLVDKRSLGDSLTDEAELAAVRSESA